MRHSNPLAEGHGAQRLSARERGSCVPIGHVDSFGEPVSGKSDCCILGLRRIEQAGDKMTSRVQLYCEFQRDWASTTLAELNFCFESGADNADIGSVPSV